MNNSSTRVDRKRSGEPSSSSATTGSDNGTTAELKANLVQVQEKEVAHVVVVEAGGRDEEVEGSSTMDAEPIAAKRTRHVSASTNTELSVEEIILLEEFQRQITATTTPSGRSEVSEEMETHSCTPPPDHPLEEVRATILPNTEVLEMIAKHLPAWELLTQRETCILWNSSFLPQLKEQHSRIDLVDSKSPRLYANRSRPVTIQDFTQQMNTSSGIPYTKYFIDNICAVSTTDVKDFFSVCGESLRSLHLPVNPSWENNTNKISVQNIKRLRTIIFECTPELNKLRLVIGKDFKPAPKTALTRVTTTTAELPSIPNLHHLTLIRHKLGRPSEILHPLYCDLLADIFASAINLNYLVLKDFSPSLVRDILVIVRNSMRNISTLMYLKTPRLNNSTVFDVLTTLGKRDLQDGGDPLLLRLEEFATSLQWEQLHDWIMDGIDEEQHAELIKESFFQFLSTQSSSLKKLEIRLCSRSHVHPRITLQLPRMPELCAFSFKITSPYAPRLPILFEEDETLEDIFPSLQCFQFEYVHDRFKGCPMCPTSELQLSYTNLKNSQTVSHSGVTDLFLSFSDTPDTPIRPILANFATNFPSITVLELALSLDIHEKTILRHLFTICAQWSSLQELYLALGEMSYNCQGRLNRLLSGVPISNHKVLKQKLSHLPKRKAWESIPALRSKYKTYAGLSDLKQLRKFVLNFNFYEIDGRAGSADKYDERTDSEKDITKLEKEIADLKEEAEIANVAEVVVSLVEEVVKLEEKEKVEEVVVNVENEEDDEDIADLEDEEDIANLEENEGGWNSDNDGIELEEVDANLDEEVDANLDEQDNANLDEENNAPNVDEIEQAIAANVQQVIENIGNEVLDYYRPHILNLVNQFLEEEGEEEQFMANLDQAIENLAHGAAAVVQQHFDNLVQQAQQEVQEAGIANVEGDEQEPIANLENDEAVANVEEGNENVANLGEGAEEEENVVNLEEDVENVEEEDVNLDAEEPEEPDSDLELEPEDDLNLDIGGYFGIAACPQLQHIEIRPYEIEEPHNSIFVPNLPMNQAKLKHHFISAECLEYIETSLSPYTIIRL